MTRPYLVVFGTSIVVVRASSIPKARAVWLAAWSATNPGRLAPLTREVRVRRMTPDDENRLYPELRQP